MLDGLTGVVIDGRQPGNRKGVAVDPHWVALRVSVDDLKTLVFYSPRDRPQFLQRHLDDIVRVEVLNASSPMVLDVAIDRTKIAIVTIRPRLAFSYGNPVEASIQLEYFGVEQ